MIIVRESVLDDALHRLEKPLFDPAKRLNASSVFPEASNGLSISRLNLLPKMDQTQAALLGNSSLLLQRLSCHTLITKVALGMIPLRSRFVVS